MKTSRLYLTHKQMSWISNGLQPNNQLVHIKLSLTQKSYSDNHLSVQETKS